MSRTSNYFKKKKCDVYELVLCNSVYLLHMNLYFILLIRFKELFIKTRKPKFSEKSKTILNFYYPFRRKQRLGLISLYYRKGCDKIKCLMGKICVCPK